MTLLNILKHLPDKHDQETHGHSDAIEAAKLRVVDRARKLSYGNVTFVASKKGLQIVTHKVPGKDAKQNLFIGDDGRILNKDGKPAIGWD